MKKSVKYILRQFELDGFDDFEVKKENNVIVIGYFHQNPADCVVIKDNHIDKIYFSRQPSLDWIYSLLDNKVYIEDDYFV